VLCALRPVPRALRPAPRALCPVPRALLKLFTYFVIFALSKNQHDMKISRRNEISSTFFAAGMLFIVSVIAGCARQDLPQNEWPCFHGPDRGNKSPETGLLREWPEEGPELLFTVNGLGEGFSSVSIADGMIFTAGSVDSQPWVFAFDLTGKLLWKAAAGEAWSTTARHASSYTGARGTPTYDDGVVYYLGEMGRLSAMEAATGKELWVKDLSVEYEAPGTEYGYSESVYIDGDNLYVRPAGKKGYKVCLNKHDGSLVWANTEIPGVEGYSSPVVHEFGGYRQVIGASSIGYYSVDAATGKLLWKVDFINRHDCNITDAVVSGEHVFVTSGYGRGSMMFRINVSDTGMVPEEVWEFIPFDNHHGGVILHEGYLYGSGSQSKGWFCVDFLTGEQMWKVTGDEAAITYADGMIYMLDQRGTMTLFKATPEKYEIAGSFRIPEGGKGMHWAHPVVCGGRLYIRHDDRLFVYGIKG
jgi:outer membrane protein assembly factor BamB